MRTLPTLWLLLFGLLLQSVAWAMPARQAGLLERLAHEQLHALDHGHHGHPAQGMSEATGHDAEPALVWDAGPDHGDPGSPHSHAGETGQVQTLPMASQRSVPLLPRGAPAVRTPLQPASALAERWLRPPRHPA